LPEVQNETKLKIYTKLCVGCAQCFIVCSFDALEMEWGTAKVNEEECVLCGQCVEYCPVQALELEIT